MKERSGIACFRLGIWKLGAARGGGGYGEVQMPPMRRGGERLSCIVDVNRNAELERAAPEEQMATYEDRRGNITQEGTHSQKCH